MQSPLRHCQLRYTSCACAASAPGERRTGPLHPGCFGSVGPCMVPVLRFPGPQRKSRRLHCPALNAVCRGPAAFVARAHMPPPAYDDHHHHRHHNPTMPLPLSCWWLVHIPRPGTASGSGTPRTTALLQLQVLLQLLQFGLMRPSLDLPCQNLQAPPPSPTPTQSSTTRSKIPNEPTHPPAHLWQQCKTLLRTRHHRNQRCTR